MEVEQVRVSARGRAMQVQLDRVGRARSKLPHDVTDNAPLDREGARRRQGEFSAPAPRAGGTMPQFDCKAQRLALTSERPGENVVRVISHAKPGDM